MPTGPASSTQISQIAAGSATVPPKRVRSPLQSNWCNPSFLPSCHHRAWSWRVARLGRKTERWVLQGVHRWPTWYPHPELPCQMARICNRAQDAKRYRYVILQATFVLGSAFNERLSNNLFWWLWRHIAQNLRILPKSQAHVRTMQQKILHRGNTRKTYVLFP